MLDTTSSFNSGATRHGLFCDDQADHVWNNFGGWVSLFHGGLDSIHPRPRMGAEYCYIRALDEVERLNSITLYTYSSSSLPQTSDAILGDILDYAGVSSALRQMDSGTALVPDTWSPPIWGVRGMAEVHRLQDEEDGFIYVDGHGYWRLESRTHRTTAPHTTSKATIKDTNDGTNPYFTELVWEDGHSNIENMVFMWIRDATNGGPQTAWTLKEKPQFEANETKEFLAETKTYDFAAGQVSPVENTDYDANTNQGGSGTDISSELTVTHPNTADFNGKGTLIRVKFGATAGYLTLLKLRTLNAFTFDDPVLVVAEDVTSKSTYGRRTRSMEARWTREVAVAQATVDSRLARKKDPKTVLSLVVSNGSKANLMLLLQRAFSDRVTVSYSDMGISGDFFVEGRRIVIGLRASCCSKGCRHGAHSNGRVKRGRGPLLRGLGSPRITSKGRWVGVGNQAEEGQKSDPVGEISYWR